MEIIEQEKQRMNEIYFTLSTKQAQLFHGLYHRIFELSSGFYNGHERQTPDGGWQMDYYPIPVISVKGFFDVEISPDGISVTTKKKRKDALAYSFEKLRGYSFEAFGVESYLDTFYRDGMTIAELKENISRSEEREIGFCFSLPWDTDGETMYEFAKLLRREGFYY